MSSKSPEQASVLFREFREMQARHLSVLSGRESGSIRDVNQERQVMLQRLQNWFATDDSASMDPQYLMAELKTLMETEEELKRRAGERYREKRSEMETIRTGKKMLTRYSEKGYGLGDAPHFVSRTT